MRSAHVVSESRPTRLSAATSLIDTPRPSTGARARSAESLEPLFSSSVNQTNPPWRPGASRALRQFQRCWPTRARIALGRCVVLAQSCCRESSEGGHPNAPARDRAGGLADSPRMRSVVGFIITCLGLPWRRQAHDREPLLSCSARVDAGASVVSVTRTKRCGVAGVQVARQVPGTTFVNRPARPSRASDAGARGSNSTRRRTSTASHLRLGGAGVARSPTALPPGSIARHGRLWRADEHVPVRRTRARSPPCSSCRPY